MQCYIKDGRSFVTKCICPVVDFAYTVHSIYDEVSSLSVATAGESPVRQGDIVVADDYIGRVSEVQESEGAVALKCEHISKLFSRDLLYREPVAGQSLEEYVRREILHSFVELEDEVYRLPFVQVECASRTVCDIWPEAEEGVWNLLEYLAQLRRLEGIHMEFAAERSRLVVTLRRRDEKRKKLDLANPAIRILEESYADKAVGRITSHNAESGAVKDWYLLTDGRVTDAYQPQERVAGEWKLLVVKKGTAEEVELKVRDEFAKNSFTHKILFDMPAELARFGFYDRLVISHGERIFYSFVAAVRKSQKSNRLEYQCGELRTTWTDKIQEEL